MNDAYTNTRLHLCWSCHSIFSQIMRRMILRLFTCPLWGGRVVLCKFPVPGRPTFWIIVGQGPIALAAGAGCLDIFTLLYPFSPLSPSLSETARYTLKYCLKGPLHPNQPTNQPLALWHFNYMTIACSVYFRKISVSRSHQPCESDCQTRFQGISGGRLLYRLLLPHVWL